MRDLRTIFLSFIFSFLGAATYFKLQVEPLSYANAANPAQVIQASRIDLLDSDGKLKAQIGFSGEKSPALWFFDGSGKARMNLGLYGDGTAFISLQDKRELSIQLMRAFGPGEMPLHIFKSGGTDQMIQGLNPSGQNEPFVMFYDKSRKRSLNFGKYDGP